MTNKENDELLVESLELEWAEGTTAGQERRHEFRQRMSIPIRVTLGGQISVSGSTVDISKTGVGVRSPEVLPVGARIQLSLELPSRRLEGKGEIVRRTKSGAGGKGYIFGVKLDEPMKVHLGRPTSTPSEPSRPRSTDSSDS